MRAVVSPSSSAGGNGRRVSLSINTEKASSPIVKSPTTPKSASSRITSPVKRNDKSSIGLASFKSPTSTRSLSGGALTPITSPVSPWKQAVAKKAVKKHPDLEKLEKEASERLEMSQRAAIEGETSYLNMRLKELEANRPNPNPNPNPDPNPDPSPDPNPSPNPTRSLKWALNVKTRPSMMLPETYRL